MGQVFFLIPVNLFMGGLGQIAVSWVIQVVSKNMILY